MTEAEWQAGADPADMYFMVIRPRKRSGRQLDHFCVACAQLVLHLLNREARRAFQWLEEHPGSRLQAAPNGGHVRERFKGPARGLYDAHLRREGGVAGAAAHVAYDLWAEWYEYAFDNLFRLVDDYPGAIREKSPRAYLVSALRDIFGNPFRPVAFDPSWRTSTSVALAEGIYADRAFDRLPILADALEDAGCDAAELLAHLRDDGPHVRGCWALDLVLGKA